jgi:hypothetical protein
MQLQPKVLPVGAHLHCMLLPCKVIDSSTLSPSCKSWELGSGGSSVSTSKIAPLISFLFKAFNNVSKSTHGPLAVLTSIEEDFFSMTCEKLCLLFLCLSCNEGLRYQNFPINRPIRLA